MKRGTMVQFNRRRDPYHETDRHRLSLDAVRCPRWWHLSPAYAAAAELCCRDLSHPGRLHRAQQPFSLLPLTNHVDVGRVAALKKDEIAKNTTAMREELAELREPDESR